MSQDTPQSDDLYSLMWNNHLRNLKGAFEMFRTDTSLVDVTLSCEGKQLKAHKIILSACSLYFWDLFRENPCHHPIVILRDVQYQNMVDLLTFMYLGEVNVSMEHLNSFLKTAEFLQVKGLMEDRSEGKGGIQQIINQNLTVDHTILEPKIITTETKEEKSEDENSDKKNFADNMTVDEPNMKTENDDIDVVDNTMFEFIGNNTSDTNLSVDGNEVPYYTNEIIDVFVRQTKEMKKTTYTKRKVPSCNKLFHCTVCGKKFVNRDSVYKHMQSHEGRTNCPICHKILSRRSHVLRHIASKHGHLDNY